VTGPSLGPLTRCPFGPCLADLMLVIEQAAAGDDETILKRVPQHRLVGEAERFGQCPASLMVMPLDAHSRETLQTMAAEIGRMVAPPPEPEAPREAVPRGGVFPVGRPRRPGEHPLTPHPDPRHPWFRPGPGQGTHAGRGGQNVPQQGRAGQSVVPMPDEPHAGPGPGRASKPFQPQGDDVNFVVPPLRAVPDLPAGQTSRQGSSTGMSNDLRAQLIALTTIAIEGFGQQQEQCAALTACLDETFGAIRQALAEKQASTHSIALAAVGSRSDVPKAAAAMIGASAGIGSTLTEVEGTEALLRGFVAATHAYAGRAAAQAQAYLAQI
jgi:hypothetical protein